MKVKMKARALNLIRSVEETLRQVNSPNPGIDTYSAIEDCILKCAVLKEIFEFQHQKLADLKALSERQFKFHSKYDINEPVEPDDYLMTLEQFRAGMRSGEISDRKGSVYASTGKYKNTRFEYLPSEIDSLPANATHIVWCDY